MVVIRRLSEFPCQRWNRFVMEQKEATCFHLSEWAEVSMSLYGWDPYYLYAEDSDTIRAVLPLVHVKHRFARQALVSTPFCVYGGVLAENSQMTQILEEAAADIARELGVAYLEVRQSIRSNPQWTTADLYCTFKRQLLDDVDANFAAVPRKQRAMVRKGASAGLTVSFGHNQDLFYEIFAAGAISAPQFIRANCSQSCCTFSVIIWTYYSLSAKVGHWLPYCHSIFVTKYYLITLLVCQRRGLLQHLISCIGN